MMKNELIGIKSLQSLRDTETLKKDLLFFDKIFIVGIKELYDAFDDAPNNIYKPQFDNCMRLGYSYLKDILIASDKFSDVEELEKSGYKCRELEYLISQGKVLTYDRDIIDLQKYSNGIKEVRPILEEKVEELKHKPNKFIEFCTICHDLKVRILSNSLDTYHYTGVSSNESIYDIKDITSRKSEVYNLILNDFPLLDGSTPWEKIFEFKSDADSYNSIWALRNWISKIAKTDLSLNEIEEEYRYLIHKYERSLAIHNMKVTNSTFQSTLQITSELIENVAKFKFKKIVDMAFKFREDKISLMETELNSEGNQFSYLFTAKKRFS